MAVCKLAKALVAQTCIEGNAVFSTCTVSWCKELETSFGRVGPGTESAQEAIRCLVKVVGFLRSGNMVSPSAVEGDLG